MSLVEEFKVPCVLMDLKRIPDGEGGWTNAWSEGIKFDAAIERNTTLTARIAEQEGLTNVYMVTVGVNAVLKFHDVFKRVSDGQIFRVTSNADDMTTPARASFQFRQVTAEEWRLN